MGQMEESYILVLLTILILMVVVVGYFGQKKLREIELQSNALKCDFETHTDQVNNIIANQNQFISNMGVSPPHDMHSGGEDPNQLDLSKIRNIMTENFDELNSKNEAIYKNLNNSTVKCIDESDVETDEDEDILENDIEKFAMNDENNSEDDSINQKIIADTSIETTEVDINNDNNIPVDKTVENNDQNNIRQV